MRVKWARNNESPSSSKPYQVLEPLPVWGGITEDDSLVRILSHCHGNNSCDQSALVRVDSGPPISPGILLQVNVGWTDAEERNCPPRNDRDWPLKQLHDEQRDEETGHILCCQCIVDRRKSVWTASLWHKNLAHVELSSPTPSRFLSLLPPVHTPSLPPIPSPNPPIPHHATTALCFCECYSVNPCWLKDSFVQC